MHSTVPIRTTQKTTTTKKKKEIPTDESLVVVHIFSGLRMMLSITLALSIKKVKTCKSKFSFLLNLLVATTFVPSRSAQSVTRHFK